MSKFIYEDDTSLELDITPNAASSSISFDIVTNAKSITKTSTFKYILVGTNDQELILTAKTSLFRLGYWFYINGKALIPHPKKITKSEIIPACFPLFLCSFDPIGGFIGGMFAYFALLLCKKQKTKFKKFLLGASMATMSYFYYAAITNLSPNLNDYLLKIIS
ncbi:MAG: hypothetical protein LBU55_03435 [Elusimicrobiota bacterium]|jgi:hypothetical protein|nr:hypothetical protein [Elusimicrobiota bacterium]